MEMIKRDTDYALRALVYMAGRDDDAGPIMLTDIAGATEVSVQYLQKIFQKLVRGGILVSRRGAKGGYELDHGVLEMSARKVIEAVQGPLYVNKCFKAPDLCPRERTCVLRPRLKNIQSDINRLFNVPLKNMVLPDRKTKGA